MPGSTLLRNFSRHLSKLRRPFFVCISITSVPSRARSAPFSANSIEIVVGPRSFNNRARFRSQLKIKLPPSKRARFFALALKLIMRLSTLEIYRVSIVKAKRPRPKPMQSIFHKIPLFNKEQNRFGTFPDNKSVICCKLVVMCCRNQKRFRHFTLAKVGRESLTLRAALQIDPLPP